MSNWVIFKEYLNSSEAKMEAEYLENNGFSVQLHIDEPIPGLVNCAEILVLETELEKIKALTLNIQ